MDRWLSLAGHCADEVVSQEVVSTLVAVVYAVELLG
jgi:hypothetical protein